MYCSEYGIRTCFTGDCKWLEKLCRDFRKNTWSTIMESENGLIQIIIRRCGGDRCC